MKTTWSLLLPLSLVVLLVGSSVARGQAAAEKGERLFARQNLVAWCIVPFDAKKRGPAERAEMVKRLGFPKVAYDWRDEHVASFEQEILEYQKQGLEYFAFWGVNEVAFRLFEKYDLHPQIWLTPPNPTAPTRDEQIKKAAASLMLAVERTRKAGCPLGLYNHGGWGGEPENLVAVCEYLRAHHDAKHVGIVYNLHHGHDHVERFPKALAAMKPYLLCLNLNGMTRDGEKRGQKILPLGRGELDVSLLKIIRDSGYHGPIGIIGHTQDDVEQRLRDNLDGLDWLLPQLSGREPGPKPKYRTDVPAPPPPAPPTGGKPELRPGRFGQALDAATSGLLAEATSAQRAAPITVECWTKLSSKAGFNILVASEPKASARHWELYSYAGSGVFSVYMPGRGGEYRSSVDIADGQWHHVAMVYEPKRLRLFVDGKPAADKELAGVADPASVGNSAARPEEKTQLAFGRLVEGGVGCAGLLDEVHVRRGAFGIDQLPTKAPEITETTVGLWRFDELLDKTKVKDESRSSSTATAVAAATSPAAAPGAKPRVPAHWGKGQVGFEGWEEDWVDKRWQQAEIGDWLGAIVALPQGPYRKALNIRVGDERQATVCFDTQYLTLRAAWTGFLEFNPTRFGIISPPKPTGDVLFTLPEKGGWNGEPLRYRGMHVQGRRVVVSYTVGGVEVQESPWVERTAAGLVVTRTLEVGPAAKPLECLLLDTPLQADGTPVTVLLAGSPATPLESQVAAGRCRTVLKVAAGEQVRRFKICYSLARPADLPDAVTSAPPAPLRELMAPGPARWTEKIETIGHRAADDAPYVVDTFTLPFDNPYQALLFTSGHDFLSNGDILVSTVHGDVWRVRQEEARGATSGKRKEAATFKLLWRRIATGLHQPLGLVVKRAPARDEVFVLGRDQITRLHDTNGDGETDFYECFSNVYPTSAGGHDYITCLEQDSAGRFFFVHANLGVVRISEDGRAMDVIATGLRNPNGMGLGPGDVVTAAPQEGEWTPASAIYVARPGAHFGGGGPRVTDSRPLGYDPPLVWIPRRVDNSSGGQTWVTSDRWGPFAGRLLHLSFGQCSLMLVGEESGATRDGSGRTAFITEFPFRFDSGAMRGRFSPHDGQLYVTGLRGWTSAATQDGCLQRVRFTGRPVDMPIATKVFRNGVATTFTEPLDKDAAEQPGNYHVERWNYRYSQAYGSPEFRVSDPKQEGRDEVRVRSATLLDEKTVFLELNDVRPVHVQAISFSLKSAASTEANVGGQPSREIRRTIYQTINAVGGEKMEESRLTRRADAGALDEAEEAGLRPGLLARFSPTSAASTGLFADSRVDRLASLFVKRNSAATPFLPPGPFRARWEGFMRVPLRQTVSFRIEGAGMAALTINDHPVAPRTALTPHAPIESLPVTLVGGFNKLVLEYECPADADGRLRLLWEAAEFAREPVPSALFYCHGDDPALRAAEQLRRGRELFASLRCVACHAEISSGYEPATRREASGVPAPPPAAPDTPSRIAPELIAAAPNLAAVGRFQRSWIANWIADPQARHAAARMPRMNVTGREAADIARWLESRTMTTAKTTTIGDAGAGATAYEELGCVTCHRLTSEGRDPYRRRSLSHVQDKFAPGGLADFLEAPLRDHETSRMPDFHLDAPKAASLAAYLLANSKPTAQADVLDGSREDGEKLFRERGCAQCHAVGDQPARPRAEPAPLVDIASAQGCLAVEPHSRAGTPWYELAPADRAALVKFLATDLSSLVRPAASEAARTLTTLLRCSACHDRDGERSPRGRIIAEETERGLAPEPLPNLTWAGDKLHAPWARSFIAGELRATTLRPWLKARMPSFPAYAAALAEGIAAEHGWSAEPPAAFAADPQLAQVGNELTQRTALDCRQCHAVGDQPAQGDDQTKIAPGINFALVKDRVRHDYYERFTLDPPRFDISTKMPKLAADGRTTKVASILAGDARRQFDAIWHFLQHVGVPESAPTE